MDRRRADRDAARQRQDGRSRSSAGTRRSAPRRRSEASQRPPLFRTRLEDRDARVLPPRNGAPPSFDTRISNDVVLAPPSPVASDARAAPARRAPAALRSICAITPGIVHLGVGAFHRAHQAVYVERRPRRRAICGWGIVAASLRSPDTRDALSPQDGLYTLAVRARPMARSLRVVGALQRIARRARGPIAVASPPWPIRASASSRLTVTEKGYCHDPATGELERGAPRHPRRSRQSAQRHARRPASSSRRCACDAHAGTPPFTVLTCDNLPGQWPHRRSASSLRHAELARRRVSAPSSRTRSPFRRPWSTASFRRPPTPIAPPISSDSAVAMPGPSSPSRSRQWVIEDRFHARTAAFRGVRRRARRAMSRPTRR